MRIVPWAEVWVDGELYDVTPFAKPIGLMPGQHTVEFRNRFFGNEMHTVEVEAGDDPGRTLEKFEPERWPRILPR